MNSKRVNWLFTAIIALNVIITLVLAKMADTVSIGVMPSLVLSQAMIFVPAVFTLLITKTRPGELIAAAKPKWLTAILVIIITYLCVPLITTVNVFSQLFVENEVINLQPLLQEVPGWQLILFVGIIGPVSEEFVFRGVIYHGYRRSGRFVAAMVLSAVLFGLMHLNFNQMSYAIVVGIIGVMLVEGTGSIFYSMLFHICINTTNVIQIVLQNPETAAMDAQQAQQMMEQMMKMPYEQVLCIVVSIYAVISCFTVAIAGCLYYLVLKLEGRTEHVRLMFVKEGQTGIKDQNRKLWSWPLVISVAYCIVYMIAVAIWM